MKTPPLCPDDGMISVFGTEVVDDAIYRRLQDVRSLFEVCLMFRPSGKADAEKASSVLLLAKWRGSVPPCLYPR